MFLQKDNLLIRWDSIYVIEIKKEFHQVVLHLDNGIIKTMRFDNQEFRSAEEKIRKCMRDYSSLWANIDTYWMNSRYVVTTMVEKKANKKFLTIYMTNGNNFSIEYEKSGEAENKEKEFVKQFNKRDVDLVVF